MKGMTAREAAEFLGVTVGRLYKRKHKFGGRHTKHGWEFDRALVEAEKNAKEGGSETHGAMPAESRPGLGVVAAKVFTELDNGLDAVAIVRKHKIEPDTVVRFVASYHALKGGLLLSGTEIDRLVRLQIGVRIGAKADEVVNMVEALAAGVAPCGNCHVRPPAICRECARAPARRR